jgi:ubiquinone/menaquinone biosynthesis C-methylase UbiE
MLPTPSHNEYLLGHSSNEEERLRRLPGELALDSSRFLDQFGIQPGSQAVDLGCGPRGILDLLAERVGKSGTVVGVEQNESTLNLARQFIAERELRNVELQQGDAKATGLPRASFDVVHARLVLVNVPEPQLVVKEMVGLARPGGIVASHEADWGASICDPPSRAWDRLVAVFEGYSRSLGIDLFVGRKTHQMFREAGLINVQVTPLIHSYPLGNSRRNILCDLLESVHDRVVMKGLLTEVEYQEELSQLKRHLADAGTLVIPHLFFQVWGRKPELHSLWKNWKVRLQGAGTFSTDGGLS